MKSHQLSLSHQALGLKRNSKFCICHPWLIANRQLPRHRLLQDLSALGDHVTDLQRSKLQDRMYVLQRKIEQWCQVQVLYMPSMAPSELPEAPAATHWKRRRHMKSVYGSLRSSRIMHHTLSVTNDFANLNGICAVHRHLTHWMTSTGISFALTYINSRILTFRVSEPAHMLLLSSGRSSIILQRLAKATATHGPHLAGYAEYLERMAGRVSFLCSSQLMCTECQRVRQVNPKATRHFLGSGRCRVSQQLGRFLQMVSSSNFLADMVFSILSSALRIEWCKARAHTNRWREEVQLLLEEMRCVRAFLSWHAAWWDEQAGRWTGLPDAETEGIKGYAKCQASLRRNLQIAFDDMWVMIESLATAEAQM